MEAGSSGFLSGDFLKVKTSDSLLSQFVTCDFSGIHGVGQILFVGEDEENGFSEFVLVQHPIQLLASFTDSLTIVAVNHEDQSLRE